MTEPSPWDPAQYDRFERERRRPFLDLLDLVDPRAAMTVLDLGCGTGARTVELHRRLRARETVGVDRSETMLAEAWGRSEAGLRFERAALEAYAPAAPVDLVVSNAALQWVEAPAQDVLLERLSRHLRPGGQLAVQVPANHDHVSHLVAMELARSEPFASALGGWVRTSPVLPVDEYARTLHRVGFVEQRVRLEVYAHLLESPEAVVEWVKGTLLTAYQERLEPRLFDELLARYREVLLPRLGDERPHFYPFKRILLWGRRPA